MIKNLTKFIHNTKKITVECQKKNAVILGNPFGMKAFLFSDSVQVEIQINRKFRFYPLPDMFDKINLLVTFISKENTYAA